MRILENMPAVIHLLAWVQQPQSRSLLSRSRPSLTFGSIAMPGCGEEIAIVVTISSLRLKVIYLHTLLPTRSLEVLHRVCTPVLEVD
jgi:hypothetical protein